MRMHSEELAHLDWLSRIDSLREQLRQWKSAPIDWEPLQPAQALVNRLLERMEPLRIRWEAPLVVATFGGTGTGKSSLVNALVGEQATLVGKERPTTRRPTLVCHSDVDPAQTQIPLDQVDVVRCDRSLLRDILLLDCPDPDTSESDEESSNLRRLHELLPACDVLLYVSTQQKYRSARVGDELGKAADSCRLVFVQTHADFDADIRDDWRRQLEPHYRIAEMFFVDSRRAFSEQQQGLHPTGDFGRLLTFLARELAASRRAGIRRANLLDLLDLGLEQAIAQVQPALAALGELEAAIATARRQLARKMSQKIAGELSACRNLWERRLLEQVTQSWGASPFGGLLRLYQAQTMLLASWSLVRARNTAQLALWGVWQGSRWFGQQQQLQASEVRMKQFAEMGLDTAEFRAAQFTVAGYVHSAHIGQEASSDKDGNAAGAAADFVAEATRRLDGVIQKLASRNSGWFSRNLYELLFLIFPVFLLFRIGKNYFYDSFWNGEPLLEMSFYLPSLLFLIIWCVAFLWHFLSRLRRGIQEEIQLLAAELAESPAFDGLFADLETRCRQAREQFAQLQWLHSAADSLRQSLEDDSRLGGRREHVSSAPVGGKTV